MNKIHIIIINDIYSINKLHNIWEDSPFTIKIWILIWKIYKTKKFFYIE